jgi:RNA polymerase sigma factor (sigma-70 family)
MDTGRVSKVLQHIRQASLGDGGTLTDGQLLESFLASREQAAFEALLRRHGRMVLGVCRRILKNAHDAEDAFQVTFLVLIRKATSLLSRHTVGDWLYGVAYHTALKARAAILRRKTLERRGSEMAAEGPPTDELWQELRPLLDRELSLLPEKYRKPVVLCDLEGKTRQEAAQQLGWPEGTVHGRLARARVLLARRLSRHGLALSGGSLALLLPENAASAGVPSALAASTAKAAGLLVAGESLAACAVSAQVAGLTDGVLHSMAAAKLLKVGAVVLVFAVVGSATAVLAWDAATPGPHTDTAPLAVAQIQTSPQPDTTGDGKGASKGTSKETAGSGRKVLAGQAPDPVLDAVLARFPDAELLNAKQEESVYDVAIKFHGRNIDVTVTPEGAITRIEREIIPGDVPAAVTLVLEKKYPRARPKKFEEVFRVEGAAETLEFYEVSLTTARRRTITVGVAPDGTIIKEEK